MAINDNDRRHGSREPKNQKVTFTLNEAETKKLGLLLDSSKNGAFIETSEMFPLGSKIVIKGKSFYAEAYVIRVFWVSPGDNLAKKSGMAVRYSKSTQFDTRPRLSSISA